MIPNLRPCRQRQALSLSCTPERVVSRLSEILSDGTARAAMLEGLARVKARLRSPNGNDSRPAAERAADAVLQLLRLKDYEPMREVS